MWVCLPCARHVLRRTTESVGVCFPCARHVLRRTAQSVWAGVLTMRQAGAACTKTHVLWAGNKSVCLNIPDARVSGVWS